jgi:hypothetical protein
VRRGGSDARLLSTHHIRSLSPAPLGGLDHPVPWLKVADAPPPIG